ncbi:hypothetical protein EA462_15205 [Natrarchaeobius halalkaliphilus]|uniref:DUF8009 domain-containing protein n=1 Tax=Natrarchaeobius halalkaliphilus TaxID=1679091 RepID=A0A3N6LZ15_9EURY|nr:hypothetical protein [Natrarchaeobius halalkaliphilus]RQG86992.1 hypothetical protein EA462_15205 [Natrarchaeobius halalkaliphilus]
MTADDPSVIRSLAISTTDIVDAYAYTQENPGTAVIRVTPPFHGRMRARIHVYRIDDVEHTDAIHVSPADLIEDDVVDSYPGYEDELAREGEGTSPPKSGGFGNRRAAAVDGWRARARDAIVDTVSLGEDDARHGVVVKALE